MTKIFTTAENDAWSKQLPGKMTSACLVVRNNNRVLMVKAGYKDHWTFPSGIVDDKESPKAAAIRETLEEVGLSVASEACSLFTVVYTGSNGSDRDRFNFAYLTDSISPETQLDVPNDEIEKAEWVEISNIAEKSGNKGSYLTFMNFLLNPAEAQPYVEIIPQAS